MHSYRLQGVEELQDCDGSIHFCKLINDVADAMNSNRPVNGLRTDSEQFKVGQTMLELLKHGDASVHLYKCFFF